MRYIAIVFLFIISIFSCESSAQSINIPDQIKVSNIENKVNVKGTKILINESKDYIYYNELKRFQKDSKNYFQVIEIPNQDYHKSVIKISNKIDELEKQGGRTRVKKELKLGLYDAYFVLAPQNNDSEQIILAFGDTSFSVLVMGVFPNDEKERKEITDLVLSTYYDKNIKVNISDNLFYDVDLKKSEFELLNVMSNFGTYTIGKEQLVGNGIYINNFLIGVLPNNLNGFDLKTYSDKLIYKYGNNIYKEKNIKIKVISEEKCKEGVNEIIKVEMSGVFEGKELKMYQYIKQTPKGIIQFLGTDISKKYTHFSEYTKIAESIKIK
ncbi:MULTISPECIES: hypothetical protein [unclassified Flavobacterium]|uniref:hypothetical protein n=1 Tax=unclassified Flavobacterium TaxID=196869 RepID=UPI0012A8FC31|nr:MULTISPECIES: hypothetical protein [unclassified Flavobacterium]MBF4485345.1 hypothetical protein [Flavobacterium sp. CSZ]QGK74579.1 hypothetical protein GIY83_11105 [Flavobacterium sp. SLB02]